MMCGAAFLRATSKSDFVKYFIEKISCSKPMLGVLSPPEVHRHIEHTQ